MRSFDERIAEINRRSERILKERKKRRKRLLLGCIPLAVCLIVFTALFLPKQAPTEQAPTSPVTNGSNAYFAQLAEQGKIKVSGPGIYKIYHDDSDVTRIIGALYGCSKPDSVISDATGEGEATDNGLNGIFSTGYKITWTVSKSNMQWRLTGNRLENITDGQSHTLTDSQVAFLKDTLGISKVSMLKQLWITVVVTLLLLIVFFVLILSISKRYGNRKRRSHTLPSDHSVSPEEKLRLSRMKRIWIIVLIGALLLAVLFVPILRVPEHCSDRDTRVYSALTYKVIRWKIHTGSGIYEKTAWHGFPDNFKSFHELWLEDIESNLHTVTATVVEINGNSVVVQPIPGQEELRSSDRLTFSAENMARIDPPVGSDVDIDYIGDIMETYPAQIQTIRWRMSTDLRHREYTAQWLDPETAQRHFEHYGPAFTDITITEIYSNCFFARSVIPKPYTIKLNGQLSDDYQVGDQLICTYEKLWFDEENRRMEADLLTVEVSDVVVEYDVYF